MPCAIAGVARLCCFSKEQTREDAGRPAGGRGLALPGPCPAVPAPCRPPGGSAAPAEQAGPGVALSTRPRPPGQPAPRPPSQPGPACAAGPTGLLTLCVVGVLPNSSPCPCFGPLGHGGSSARHTRRVAFGIATSVTSLLKSLETRASHPQIAVV